MSGRYCPSMDEIIDDAVKQPSGEKDGESGLIRFRWEKGAATAVLGYRVGTGLPTLRYAKAPRGPCAAELPALLPCTFSGMASVITWA